MSLHPAYHVSESGKLIEVTAWDKDPRGLVLMWEQPRAGAQYYCGVMPSLGIVNWSRQNRTQNDFLTKNAVVQIIRKGRRDGPDVQVCEFAAPIHCEDLADWVNLLGRLYGINEEDGQIPCIIEIYPGPGHMTQRRLIEEHQYTNLFVWKYTDQMILKSTGSLGWSMTTRSERDLWLRGMRHFGKSKVRILSEWMVEEMADCIINPNTLAGMTVGTRQNQRVVAMLLALWFAHEWSLSADSAPTAETGPGSKAVDWQASDMTSDEWLDAVEERYSQLAEME